ncbi:MAG: hypothetical protein H6667_25780 [Ardenticatenaceae bacterium]|nr:hypothetical protein [Ardenticatenaceae bacterium]
MNDDISELKETERRIRNDDATKIFAVVLILVGIAVLINYFTDYSLENWWALFMLLPAGYIFMAIWRDYKENGRLSRKSSGAIIPGLVMVAMVTIFLFNLSWAIFWPVTFIAIGFSILLGNR